jgi:hypothetical protein
MPYYDEQGNEVAGLHTEEELNAKLEEERQAFAKQIEEEKASAQERLVALEAEKLAAQKAVDTAKLGGGDGDKDVNFANLRRKLEETTTALEAEKLANEGRYTALQKERIDTVINTIARGDDELAKKIRFNYDTVLTGMKAETTQEINAKALAALRLSAPTSDGPDALSIALSGGNKGVHVQQSNAAKKFTSNEVAVGKSLGITDQDRNRYINDPRLK